ncbi:hypothetical protein [Chitinophaga sp. S165]|uniref:hypothetical protein n=1 Tax=Chitinophaga sp. S165 TaxID=2135462 RepID=UPI000D7125B6|nr:hypothetical protein [Chitinophaga sp. S165]PWV53515.1 hypothetical protein C7475_102265 [Chitinophaga sp. S165]
MSFDWDLYIKLGKKLCTTNNEEEVRAGISRAYYGLYNKLRIYKGLTTKFRPHKELIDKLLLAEEFDEEEDLSKLLQDLKECREQVDYDGIKRIDSQYSNRFWMKLEEALQIFNQNKT